MAADINDVLKQFDAVQANLHKLERLWETIDQMLPSGNVVEQVADYDAYRDAVRRFQFIATQMPKIDGFSLSWEFPDPDSVAGCAVSYLDIQDECPLGIAQYHDGLRQPGERLREYRFRVGVTRRKLARDTIGQFVARIDELLVGLCDQAKDKDVGYAMKQTGADWEHLTNAVKSIDAVLGDAVKRPPTWSDLSRHLHFGQRGDLDDIAKRDWPLAKDALEPLLYGTDDPLPVMVDDLGALAASKPHGQVTTELRWDKLTPADFERLLFNVVDRTEGYENPRWLTHTNAPDRGRDLSVDRLQKDVLTGCRRQRIIIACKKQASVGIDDIVKLKEQMSFWDQPRVEELIIATSGRFSTDAVQWIDLHNAKGALPRIEPWPESHLERLLASRPELIADFGLR